MSIPFSSVTVAILAGGLATRLHPLTINSPKALVPVAGEPFLTHQLRFLEAQGIRSVVLCVGHLGNMVEQAFGNGSRFGLRLQYSYDGATPLGTGGALKRALPFLSAAFFVLYGDSFLRIDLHAVWERFEQSGKSALMTVLENSGRWDRSNVVMRGDEIVCYDKQSGRPEMRHIDYGLSVFRRDAFDATSDEAFDLSILQRLLVSQGRMAAFTAKERFYEIGTPQSHAELEALLLREPLPLQ